MSTYKATIQWSRDRDQTFTDNRYSRGHDWLFDGGLKIPASASPNVVPLPLSIEENIDPEEAFVASLSSCHMLFFLSIAAKRGWVVDHYIDQAVGEMGKGEGGTLFMQRVILRPEISFSGSNQPSKKEISEIHHESHTQCFIANSVKTEVVIQKPN
ncbi:MAG: OsmC family protein [Balneolaceae bacterium]